MKTKPHCSAKQILPLIVLTTLLTLVACASPKSTLPPTPTQIAEPASESAARPAPSQQVPRITIEELLQKMESKAGIVVVDTRYKEQYDIDHIKEAVSAPLSDIVEGKWLPPPGKELILYCA